MSLKQADRPVDEVIRYFAQRGLECGLLVPTSTGMAKSIMDAHASLRGYLQETSTHDYGVQEQGPDHKKTIATHIIESDGVTDTVTSLYRPVTKTGDPRIWISQLPKHAEPRNLVAVVAEAGELYVVNTSRPGILESGSDPTSPLGSLLNRLSRNKSSAADDLFGKLRGIGAKGYIPSLRAGPTGIGFTLESHLGIMANASPAPDYRGIEIKASRTSGNHTSSSRTTIFSKVPDWNNSTIRGPVELVQACGRLVDGRMQLYCSVSDRPNSHGIFLEVDHRGEILHSMREHGTPPAKSRLVQWQLPMLKDSLRLKHPATCLVKARTRRIGGVEEFHFVSATYSERPLINNLPMLLETGHVELDFLVHLKPNSRGGVRARDHGYLFKIWERDWQLLFPSPRTISLQE